MGSSNNRKVITDIGIDIGQAQRQQGQGAVQSDLGLVRVKVHLNGLVIPAGLPCAMTL